MMDNEEAEYLLPETPSRLRFSVLHNEQLKNEHHLPVPAYPYSGIISAVWILCTLINLVVWFSRVPASQCVALPAVFSLHNSLTSQADIENLRRPSQFIGLNRIYEKFPHAMKNFTNYPLALIPIDRANPSKIFTTGEGEYIPSFGTIFPENSHLYITPTISSVVQFRATDFMMGSCELHVNIPANEQHNSSILEFSPHVDLFILQADKRVVPEKLSYSTRPPRIRKLAHIQFNHELDRAFTYKLPCASDELITFEIACPDEHPEREKVCRLEWTQNKEPSNELFGIYMMQFST